MKENEEFVNEESNESQCSKILAVLLDGRSITPLEALNLCGCFRLAARIHDLRDRGNDIITETITTNSGKKVASYRLASRQYKLAL